MRTSVLIAAALCLPADALACGGFFCNRDFPIDQSAEQVVFGIDEVEGEVEAHVSITYQGASENFAWVVPVPMEPQLFPSSDALFSTLSAYTRPQFWLYYDQTGVCEWNWGAQYDLAAEDADGGSPPGATGGNGVDVIAEELVGPYQTTTLKANSSEELLTWLQGAGYDLPDDLGPVLSPYVAEGQYFVALKLSAGKDTGDLVPLGMRYPGTAASIPIQLTSIAATPDMRLEVYVLGEHRAVPDNYLHVTINEAAIDWWSAGSNYEEVITMAADEAGGQAFATDFSGSTLPMRGSLWDDQRFDLDGLRTVDDPVAWVQGLMDMGFPPSAALLEVFLDQIPFPAELEAQGVTPQNFYDCLACYSEYVDATGFSGAEATAALEAQVVEGLQQAEALLNSHDHISRMTSSLDAIEMTIDPMFVFNADLPQERSNVHTATLVHHCGFYEGWDRAERTLVLSDEREIDLPSQHWVTQNDTTEFELIQPLTTPVAILIEDYGASGSGDILFDYRDEAALEARRFGRAGCGCATGAVPVGYLPGWLLLGGLLLRRRRS